MIADRDIRATAARLRAGASSPEYARALDELLAALNVRAETPALFDAGELTTPQEAAQELLETTPAKREPEIGERARDLDAELGDLFQ
jgi:pheromone shutdown protein TraB